jgi:hypothetical protein
MTRKYKTVFFENNLYRHMLKAAFFTLLITSLFCCGKKEEKQVSIPEGILSQELFTKVLADYALAESAANLNVANSSLQKMDSVYAFDPLAQNQVRKSQYDSAIAFYVNQPELYKKIYEDVITLLNDRQTKIISLPKDSSSK